MSVNVFIGGGAGPLVHPKKKDGGVLWEGTT
jgi:hypothetical protein